tara:strand:+ start:70 stop:369 length:300 start_codon:yes stop_codon:yes gene_type:complete
MRKAYDLTEDEDLIPRPGSLEDFERDSLQEIMKRIAEDSYKDPQELREHLLFVERLADKVQNKLLAQSEGGETSWNLKRDLKKVKDIFKVLCRILDKIE